MPGPSPWPCVAARGRLPGKDRTRARRLFSAAASPEGTESCGRPLPTPTPGKGGDSVGRAPCLLEPTPAGRAGPRACGAEAAFGPMWGRHVCLKVKPLTAR